jgi:histone acetyltransferase (RNA polymerase elongator complex component)
MGLPAQAEAFRDKLESISLVRELHIYGEVVPIKQRNL